jgi:hypothetical protein
VVLVEVRTGASAGRDLQPVHAEAPRTGGLRGDPREVVEALCSGVGVVAVDDDAVEGQWPQDAWLEARAVEQGVVLGFGALAAAGVTRTGEASASDVSE